VTDARIGARLRDAGLHPRALAAWAGTDRLSALAAQVPALAARDVTRASAVLALFVAGVDVPVAALGGLVDELDELVERRGDRARARVAILPLGRSLVVCDRLDAAADDDVVCWPDDSSYHLASALPPGRVAAWLDLGCGSTFAPLYRPALATEIRGVDVNPRAIALSQLGLDLSNVSHVTVIESNLSGAIEGGWRASLVSCNAPIPDAAPGPRWRFTHADFVARLFEHAARVVAPSGVVVVHAALDALAPVVASLPGERVVVAYTPVDATRGFAVAWWRPDAAPRHVSARRLLTEARPHLDHEDLAAALANAPIV
jgi:SAM-dependent methyltransferase